MQDVFLGINEDSGVFVLRQKFTIQKKIAKAVVRATALGMYCITLNNNRVGDIYMTPGWTSYAHTLQIQEYNVAAALLQGENFLEMTVAKGWYCGEFGLEHKRNLYGEKAAGYLYLLIKYEDGTAQDIYTQPDGAWTAAESEIRYSSIYDGEIRDNLSPRRDLSLCRVEYDFSRIIQQQSEPVRVIGRIPAQRVIKTPKGELVYDFGQNLTGVVELSLPQTANDRIEVSHAEILDKEGNFYTENLRRAKAQDVYIGCANKTVRPEFTYHGFRYARIEGIELPKESVTALVMHTDMRKTGYILTSDKRFNRLMENIVWSQKGNFLDVPTDCPQRDERLGWTGDANVFCRTAAYNFDVSRFYKKWLRDMRSEQKETGDLPVVVPDVLGQKNTAALWADSIAMIPWTLYEMYGDISFLSDNFEAIKRYLSAVEKTTENGLIVRGFQYGDWLGLDKEESMPEVGPGATDSYFVANAFYSVSLKIAEKIARILDDISADTYASAYLSLIEAMRREYFSPTGRMVCETQTAMTLALHFGIAPEFARARIAAKLNENVAVHGYHLSTGFAGTPYLLFALTDNGYHETAAKVLMNRSYPSWLYEVGQGATTVWERWNGLLPDGTPYSPAMNSFNHYAYGSVMEYVYRRVAGIECMVPGFTKIKITPHPVKGLQSVCAVYESNAGKIRAGYEWKDGKIAFFAEIPKDVEAEIILPGEESFVISGYGNFREERKWGSLETETFSLETMVKDILEDAGALAAFNAASKNMFASERILAMKNESLRRLSRFMGEDGEEKMRGIIAAANKIYMEEN